MIDLSFLSLTSKWLYIILLVLLISSLVKGHFNKGLNKYPAPSFASFTNWWRFFSVAGGKPQFALQKLHDRYGDIVRIGPNALSFSDPEAVKAIYGLTNRLNKVCHTHFIFL